MSATFIVILIIALGGGIYAMAKKRGSREKATEVMDHETDLDRREVADDLEDKRNANTWDNLNDTLDDISKR